MTRLIGIHGPYGSGKSTLARNLADALSKLTDSPVLISPFAEPTKQILRTYYDWEKGTPEARLFIEEYGNCVMKHAPQSVLNMWLAVTLGALETMEGRCHYVLADDLCYPTHLDYVIRNNGIIINTLELSEDPRHNEIHERYRRYRDYKYLGYEREVTLLPGSPEDYVKLALTFIQRIEHAEND